MPKSFPRQHDSANTHAFNWVIVIYRSILWLRKEKINHIFMLCFSANSELSALQNFPVILVNFHECKECMTTNTLIMYWNRYFLNLWYRVSTYSTVFLASLSWKKDAFSNMKNPICILFLTLNLFLVSKSLGLQKGSTHPQFEKSRICPYY